MADELAKMFHFLMSQSFVVETDTHYECTWYCITSLTFDPLKVNETDSCFRFYHLFNQSKGMCLYIEFKKKKRRTEIFLVW